MSTIAPYAAGSSGAAARLLRPVRWLLRCAARPAVSFIETRRLTRSVEHLRTMDDRLLRDIGIERSQIVRAVHTGEAGLSRIDRYLPRG